VSEHQEALGHQKASGYQRHWGIGIRLSTHVGLIVVFLFVKPPWFFFFFSFLLGVESGSRSFFVLLQEVVFAQIGGCFVLLCCLVNCCVCFSFVFLLYNVIFGICFFAWDTRSHQVYRIIHTGRFFVAKPLWFLFSAWGAIWEQVLVCCSTSSGSFSQVGRLCFCCLTLANYCISFLLFFFCTG